MKYAVIDIGSNSVRLMLWADGFVLHKEISTTRLGEGIARSPFLKAEAMERTAGAVAAFSARARGSEIYAFATAAVRAARNRDDFLKLVKERSGLNVDVVSGEDEGLLALLGACGRERGGIIDIGGASTEICYGEGGRKESSESYPVGAVRLFDLCGENRDMLSFEIGRALNDLSPSDGRPMFAVGGTASTLASLKVGMREYSAARIQDLEMTYGDVAGLADKLFSLSAEERKALPEMDIARADIIAGGALLLQTVMEKLHIDSLRFSDRDNLEGYLAYRGLV